MAEDLRDTLDPLLSPKQVSACCNKQARVGVALTLQLSPAAGAEPWPHYPQTAVSGDHCAFQAQMGEDNLREGDEGELGSCRRSVLQTH